MDATGPTPGPTAPTPGRASRSRPGVGLPLVVPVALLATGAAMVGLALDQLAYASDTGAPGPGFLPTWVGGALVVVALIDLVATARRAAREPSPEAGEAAAEAGEAAAEAGEAAAEPEDAPPASLRELLPVRVLLLLAVVAAAVVAMRYAGAPLALAGLVFALMRFVQREPVLRSLVTAVATSAAVYVVFELALGTPLPHGPFES